MPYGLEPDNSLVQTFLAAQANARAQKQSEMQQRMWQADLEKQARLVQQQGALTAARQAAVQGDLAPLWQVAPDEVLQLRKSAADQERAGLEAENLARKNEQLELETLRGPQTKLPGDVQVSEWYRNATPEQRANFDRLQQARARSSQVQVNLGDKALGLTTNQQSTVQGEVRGAIAKRTMLDDIDASIEAAGGHEVVSDAVRRARLEAGGAVSTLIPGAQSKQSQEQLAKLATVEASLAGLNNKVINDLSGAAVSESEWGRIKKSLPLVVDPAPVRRAKIAAWRRNLDILESQGADALVSGIRTGQVTLPGETPKPGKGPTKKQTEAPPAKPPADPRAFLSEWKASNPNGTREQAQAALVAAGLAK